MNRLAYHCDGATYKETSHHQLKFEAVTIALFARAVSHSVRAANPHELRLLARNIESSQSINPEIFKSATRVPRVQNCEQTQALQQALHLDISRHPTSACRPFHPHPSRHDAPRACAVV